MRKIIYFVIFFTFTFVSCEKLLEEKIYNFRTAESAFETEESTNAVLLGVYKSMQAYHYYSSTYWGVLAFNSGFTTRRDGGDADLAKMQQTPASAWVSNLYTAIYTAVSQTNFILDVVELDAEKPSTGNARGQAYFARATHYFNLVRLWGPVPMVLKPILSAQEASIPRAESVDVVYAQIIEDLENAYELLPETQENLLAPKKMAAYAMLAKVYLQIASQSNATADWEKAKYYAEQVINSQAYGLVSNYAELFDISREFSKESIFEVGFSNVSDGVGSGFTHFWVPQVSGWSSNGTGGWGRGVLTRELYDTIVATNGGVDARLATNVVTFYTRTDGKTAISYPALNKGTAAFYINYPMLQKYKDANGLNNNTHANNYIYLRYAEILLIYAEAENELNGPTQDAIDKINLLLARSRNSGGLTIPADLSLANFTQESLRNRIMVERHSELLGECHDWYDARRRGIEYFKKVCENHNKRLDLAKTQLIFKSTSDFYFPVDEFSLQRNMLLPIPESEIATNQAIGIEDQNFGY